MTAPEMLLRVTGPRFVAGVVVRGGIVVEAAPIIRRFVVGLDGPLFVACCRRMRWQWETVTEPQRGGNQ